MANKSKNNNKIKMPEEKAQSQSDSGKNKKRRLIIIVIIIILAGVLVVYEQYFYKTDQAENQVENNNETVSNTNSEASANTNKDIVSTIIDKVAQARDSKRINDIRVIQGALTSYYGDKNKYPGKLEDLIPDYLQNIPLNPTPGGITYNYTPIGAEPFKYYDLVYSLEVGVEDIAAGEHVATPSGLATP